jgi:hypothetical protein
MTGRCPVRFFAVRFVAGLCLAGMLASCAGGGVNTAADNAAASAAGHAGPTHDGSHGNPGAPGGDPAAGGGSDVQAQGNPGAPGDVAVFEEAGVPYSVLADDAAGKCAGGVCRLLAPVVGAGNPHDVGGVGECVVRKQSDIRYDPPAQGGFFRHGATVQATVDCTGTDSGTSSGSSGDAPADQAPSGPEG